MTTEKHACVQVVAVLRGSKSSQRAKLAKLLADKSDTLIMLSATPHDGKAKSFASLMNMLDPTAVADEDEYTKDDIKGLFIRRFKKDIKHQVTEDQAYYADIKELDKLKAAVLT